MMMAKSLVGVLIFFSVYPRPSFSYETLHMVDLQQVKCPADLSQEQAVGFFDVALSTNELTADGARDLPHVITFLRSTDLATDVVFQLMDGNGDVVNGGPHTLSLASLAADRRLRGTSYDALSANSSDLVVNGTEPQSLVGIENLDATERRLSSRRRAGAGLTRRRSAPSPRRRAPSPRRRTPVENGPARRRSSDPSSPAARRRGSNTAEVGNRRRATAAVAPGASPETHGRFQTAGGSGYGYTSLTTMQGNYGGRFPRPVGYGYVGKSSFGPKTTLQTSKIAPVAAGFLGGTVVGAGTFYMLSQLRRTSCSGFDCCFGCPGSCFESARESCDMGIDRDLFRDDILASGLGFYPGDFVLPLTLRILSIVGDGYDGTNVCPARNSTDATTSGSDLVVSNSFFVTLTTMDELEDLDEEEDLLSYARNAQPTYAVLICLMLAVKVLFEGGM